MPVDLRVKTTAKVKSFMLGVEIPLTKWAMRFTIQTYRAPSAWSKGISSRCQDGRHVLFLDYDKQELKQVKDEVEFLQEAFILGNAYIFQTGDDSYHVIFLDKKPVHEQYKIMKETNAEWGYTESIKMMRGREWILRVDSKGKRPRPRFVIMMNSPYDYNVISTAHRRFLEIWYGVPTIKYGNEDNIMEIPIIDYTTGNRVD